MCYLYNYKINMSSTPYSVCTAVDGPYRQTVCSPISKGLTARECHGLQARVGRSQPQKNPHPWHGFDGFDGGVWSPFYIKYFFIYSTLTINIYFFIYFSLSLEPFSIKITRKKYKKHSPVAQMMCLASFGPIFIVAGLPVTYLQPISTIELQ